MWVGYYKCRRGTRPAGGSGVPVGVFGGYKLVEILGAWSIGDILRYALN